jgi:transcription elongation factor GreA
MFNQLNHTMRTLLRKSEKNRTKDFDPYITQAKYDGLKIKLERLIKQERPQAATDVAELASDGDFSENAGYQAAKYKLRNINNNILRIEGILKYAKIIQQDELKDYIDIGSNITVLVNGKTKQLQILGGSETNPATGIISHNSPVGLALLGKKINDTVEVKLNNKTIVYKIITID